MKRVYRITLVVCLLAGLLAASHSPSLAAALGLNGHSRAMVFGTEGATDPAIYAELTGRRPESVCEVS